MTQNTQLIFNCTCLACCFIHKINNVVHFFSCKNISFMIDGEINIHFTISLSISLQWNYNCYVYSDSNINILYTVKKIVNLRPRQSQIIIILALKMLPRWISDFIANDSFDYLLYSMTPIFCLWGVKLQRKLRFYLKVHRLSMTVWFRRTNFACRRIQ